MTSSPREHWEQISGDWMDWISSPEMDPFGVEVNLPALVGLVPSPGRLTLDVGCGEGRVARLLEPLGHRVVGVDGSPALAAAAAMQGLPTAVGDGARLPFGSAVADVAISSMVLMDVDDIDGHVAELARVLRPGGSLVVAILHPISVSGFALGDEFHTFAMGDYLSQEQMDWTATRNGRSIAYKFWRRPMSTYLTALGRSGLAVVEAREPQPGSDLLARDPAAIRWTRVPMFLHLRAIRLPS